MKIHSFSLSPRASMIVEDIPPYRKNRSPGKSAKVSDAIEWYFSSPIWGRERDMDGNLTGKLVRSSHGMPVPVELYEEVEFWRSKCLSNGGVKHHLAELLRCLNPFRRRKRE